MQSNEIEQQAKAIYNHIVKTHNASIVGDPIEDLSRDELVTLIDKEFNRYGLNYLIVGNFNGSGNIQFPFNKLRTNEPLQNIDEVKELLNKKVETYLRDLEGTCKKCKAIIFDNLCAYQDKQKRKKEENPFLN